MNYNVTERLGMIRNGFEAATMGNFTDDSNFLGCIGCAIIRRKQESLNATLPLNVPNVLRITAGTAH